MYCDLICSSNNNNNNNNIAERERERERERNGSSDGTILYFIGASNEVPSPWTYHS